MGDRLVVCFDDSGHVVHAAVADFDVIPVEDLVKYVSFGKMLVDEVEEFVSNISRNMLAKGWVIPYNVSFAIA